MRHVDEGLLHAYIDGAFEAGSRDRVDIETHLAACGDCRVRLDDARRVRDVAQVALDAAAPLAAELPPWDTIVAEHARRRRSTGGAPAGAPASTRPRLPLAWAASLVLAIGAGWMARAMLAERTLAPESASMEMMAPATSADAVEDRDVGVERQENAAGDGFRTPATVPPELRRDAAPAAADRLQNVAPVPEQRAREESGAGAAKAAAPPAAAATLGAARPAAQDELERVTVAPQGVLSMVGEPAETLWVAADSGAVTAALQREPVHVDGMTADTLQLATVDGVTVVRSVFVLSEGVVEVVQRPAMLGLTDSAREAEADVLQTNLLIRGIEVVVRGTTPEAVRAVSVRLR